MKYHDDHDSDFNKIEAKGRNPLMTNIFSLVGGRKGSKALNELRGPAIIVSASGMANGGRVLHHLARYLPDPASSVIFVGYQAAGTRGRRLQDGEKESRIHGQTVPVRAHIESIGSLSAHADANEIMHWLSGFKHPPKTTFIVHGEDDSMTALRDRIVKEFGWNVTIPNYLDEVELS
jgi:metallo-beta-lactamase family protein